MSAPVAFALACALHAGFQLTVTLLVYPALLRGDHGDWERVHARHSGTIAPVVGVLYLALLATGGALVLHGPGALGWTALTGTGLALASTAVLAAPLHGRLGAWDPRVGRRLLLADRLRCVAAVVGALAAAAALV